MGEIWMVQLFRDDEAIKSFVKWYSKASAPTQHACLDPSSSCLGIQQFVERSNPEPPRIFFFFFLKSSQDWLAS